MCCYNYSMEGRLLEVMSHVLYLQHGGMTSRSDESLAVASRMVSCPPTSPKCPSVSCCFDGMQSVNIIVTVTTLLLLLLLLRLLLLLLLLLLLILLLLLPLLLLLLLLLLLSLCHMLCLQHQLSLCHMLCLQH